jgi:hypothetical protein
VSNNGNALVASDQGCGAEVTLGHASEKGVPLGDGEDLRLTVSVLGVTKGHNELFVSLVRNTGVTTT